MKNIIFILLILISFGCKKQIIDPVNNNIELDTNSCRYKYLQFKYPDTAFVGTEKESINIYSFELLYDKFDSCRLYEYHVVETPEGLMKFDVLRSELFQDEKINWFFNDQKEYKIYAYAYICEIKYRCDLSFYHQLN
jgi:hypothetical protein